MYVGPISKPIKEVPKLWGKEIWIINNEHYCMKYLQLHSGAMGSLHFHKKKDESFYIQTGVVILELDDQKLTLVPGMSVRILPGQKHRFRNDTHCYNVATILEISTTHDDNDTFRLEEAKYIEEEACKQQ